MRAGFHDPCGFVTDTYILKHVGTLTRTHARPHAPTPTATATPTPVVNEVRPLSQSVCWSLTDIKEPRATCRQYRGDGEGWRQ